MSGSPSDTLIRRLAAASVGGVAAGLLVGLLARADMRLIAMLRHDAPTFSIPGTMGILMTFLVMGGALGVLYALIKRGPLSTMRPVWWSLTGLLFLSIVLTATPLRAETAIAPQLVWHFLPTALLLGWLPAALTERMTSWLPKGSSRRARLGYVVLAIPGLVSTTAMPLLITFGVLQVTGIIPVPSS